MITALAPLRMMMREVEEVEMDMGMIRKKKKKKKEEKKKKKEGEEAECMRRGLMLNQKNKKKPSKPPRTAQSPALNLTQEEQAHLHKKIKEQAQTITRQRLSTLPPLPNGQPLNPQTRAQLKAPLFHTILKVLEKQQDKGSRAKGIQSIVPTLLIPMPGREGREGKSVVVEYVGREGVWREVKGGKRPDFERYEDMVDGCPLDHIKQGSLVEEKTELSDEARTEKDPSPLVRHKDGISSLSQKAADISHRFLSSLLLSHPQGQLIHLKTRDDVEKAIYKAAKVVLKLYKDKDVGQLNLIPVLVLPMGNGMDIQGKWVSSLGEWEDKPGDVVVSVRCE
ncbi:hypothetical protein L198_06234 [Cryptococcus wingfieldii CBS 7118]|uniref:Uncharacterized protein n=1 Tax=Cryptococcus wingfieldii CBS 7118 TaxID=1295528 RepID=A0A1E3IQK4_9TREE|nr:hypothetical protein L198_06234 [Cryptococcus wingfieldii CBS 7118]ODN90216.1 hypothetical protein L198_06234 [Cryptococcus wingfieldii CBS 7118]